MHALLLILVGAYVMGVFGFAVGGYHTARKMPELAGIPDWGLTVIYILIGLFWPLVLAIVLTVVYLQRKGAS